MESFAEEELDGYGGLRDNPALMSLVLSIAGLVMGLMAMIICAPLSVFGLAASGVGLYLGFKEFQRSSGDPASNEYTQSLIALILGGIGALLNGLYSLLTVVMLGLVVVYVGVIAVALMAGGM